MKKLIMVCIVGIAISFSVCNLEYNAASNCVTVLEDSIDTDIVCIQNLELKKGLASVGDVDGDGELSVGEMKDITSFDYQFTDGNLTTLSGIEFATNLQQLTISGNIQLYSMLPLSNLKQLEVISISSAKQGHLTNLIELAGLSNLKELTVVNQKIKSVTTPAILNLDYLDLSDNKITDVSGLENKQINTVNLSGNSIFDLSPLSAITKLYVNNQRLTYDKQYVLQNQRLTKEINVDFKLVGDETYQLAVFAGDNPSKTFTNSESFEVTLPNGTYSGVVDIEYYIVDNISADEEFSIVDPEYMTDDEILNYFNVKYDSIDVINVDMSAVDFTNPGTYPVTLFSDLGDEVIVFLTIESAPEIENPGSSQSGVDEDEDDVNDDKTNENPDSATPSLPATPIIPVDSSTTKITNTGSITLIAVLVLVIALCVIVVIKKKIAPKI